MHRAAVAEMLFLLESNKKTEATKLIQDSNNNLASTNGALGPVMEWKLKDRVAGHKLFGTALEDSSAASRWKTRCSEYFPYSTYFEGSRSSATPSSVYNQIRIPENGGANYPEAGQREDSLASNGKLEAFKATSPSNYYVQPIH